MKHRRAIPVVLASILLLGAALPVQAVEPTSVGFVVCEGQGGMYRVGKRSPVGLFYGWGTKTKRQANRFLNRSYVDATIEGNPIASADLLWTEPFKVDDDFWAVSWRYPLGKLGAGASVHVTFQVIFTQSHFDGYDTFPPGPLYAEPLECTIWTRA